MVAVRMLKDFVIDAVLRVEVRSILGLGLLLIVIVIARQHRQGDEVPIISTACMASELFTKELLLLLS